MSLKNVMVAQSGGPTVAINASLAGVIRGVMASEQYETCLLYTSFDERMYVILKFRLV